MKLIKILFAISTPLLFSACSPQNVLELNKRKSTQNEGVRQGTIYKKPGEEFNCLMVDEGLDAQAHCHNKNNTKRFYTTNRNILTNYRIIHKRAISTDRTNTFALPNYKKATVELWIVKR